MEEQPKLKAPFPYFGGKGKVANIVWQALGDVPNYIEPFAGSAAVLLSRPTTPKTETINDKDCFVANFWRALQSDPGGVAFYADWPVNEADLHARHYALVNGLTPELKEKFQTDPEYFDVQMAGWWCWGVCTWIGGGFCERAYKVPKNKKVDRPERRIPHLTTKGQGLHAENMNIPVRQIPYLGDKGRGIHRQSLFDGTEEIDEYIDIPRNENLYQFMYRLAHRLRRVRVACGDWKRVLTSAVTTRHGITGVFIDPPYTLNIWDKATYAVQDNITDAVNEWAISNGDNPQFRIVLCGYEGEHNMPNNWRVYKWKTSGGYGNINQDKQGFQNRNRERLYFSPHCLITEGTSEIKDDIEEL